MLAGFTLVEGIGDAIGGSDVHLAGALALVIGGILYAVAMIGRLLGPVPEIRSLLALVGAVVVPAGLAALTDGLPGPVRVGLAGVAVLVLAVVAAQRIPSAVAAALAALAVIASPSVVIAAAGGGIVAPALAGALALGFVVLAAHFPRLLAHPSAAVWVMGTGALVGAGVVGLLAEVDGGVAVIAAAVTALGLVTAAQRRRSVVLGFAAFAALSTTVAAGVFLIGASTGGQAAVLIVTGVLLAAAAVLAGAMSAGLLVVSGGLAIRLHFEEVVIAVAAVLTLVAATGTPGGAFGHSPFTPNFGSSSGSGSSSGGGFTFGAVATPAPTDAFGFPCPDPSTVVSPPTACP